MVINYEKRHYSILALRVPVFLRYRGTRDKNLLRTDPTDVPKHADFPDRHHDGYVLLHILCIVTEKILSQNVGPE